MNGGRGRIGGVSSAGALLLIIMLISILYLIFGNIKNGSDRLIGKNIIAISNFFDPYSDPVYQNIVKIITNPETSSASFPNGDFVEATLRSDGKRLSMDTLLNKREPCFYSITPIGVEAGYLEADFKPQGKCGKLFGQFKVDGGYITMIVRPTKQHLYPLTFLFNFSD